VRKKLLRIAWKALFVGLFVLFWWQKAFSYIELFFGGKGCFGFLKTLIRLKASI
jgi:hypothetical protein